MIVIGVLIFSDSEPGLVPFDQSNTSVYNVDRQHMRDVIRYISPEGESRRDDDPPGLYLLDLAGI